MSEGGTTSTMSNDDLRLEIAVLQHDIDAFNMKTSGQVASFYIPAVVAAADGSRPKKDSLRLYVPFEYTFTYGEDIIPKGVEFLVAFIGGDVNNGRIIARLTPFTDNLQRALAKWICRIIEIRDRQQAVMCYSDMNDFRVLANLPPRCLRVMQIMHPTYGDEFKIDPVKRIFSKWVED